MVLTAVTVLVALKDFGEWNIIIALGIAVTKASLVILYFMHVRYSDKLTWVIISAGFMWLAILFVLTMSDYYARFWLATYC